MHHAPSPWSEARMMPGVLIVVFVVMAVSVVLLVWVYKRLANLGTFGDYQLLEKIGRGGMAIIYKARHRVLKKTTALKIMDSNLLEDKDLVKKFFMEGEAIQKINQSFPDAPVVRVSEYGCDSIKTKGIPFIAMEYLRGDSLIKLIRKNKIPNLKQKYFIIKEIARALDASHQLKIFHRDISPDNVIIWGNRITLFDFGIARQELGVYKTLDGSIAGKPIYMSPEQCAGKQVTEKSDIYSLGIIFYYLLEGQPPFYDKNPVEIMNRHQQKLPPALKTDVSPGIKKTISAMLSKSPKSRPSADEVVQLLDREIGDYQLSRIAAHAGVKDITSTIKNREPASKATKKTVLKKKSRGWTLKIPFGKTKKPFLPIAKIHFLKGPLQGKSFFIYKNNTGNNPEGYLIFGRKPEHDPHFLMILSLNISRLQAKILFKDNTFTLTNFSGTNYTKVNGKDILPRKSVLVSEQDLIEMADCIFKVEKIINQKT
jgi:serine/threonine protein kinase